MIAVIEADDRSLREDQPRVLDIDFIQGHTAGLSPCAQTCGQPRGLQSSGSLVSLARSSKRRRRFTLRRIVLWPAMACG
jgi:hypothetical protein